MDEQEKEKTDENQPENSTENSNNGKSNEKANKGEGINLIERAEIAAKRTFEKTRRFICKTKIKRTQRSWNTTTKIKRRNRSGIFSKNPTRRKLNGKGKFRN